MSTSSNCFERISYDISPKNYNVKFHCDLKKFVFYGNLILDVEVKNATDTLQLNVKEVKVSDVTCGEVKGTPTIDDDKELVTIKFDSVLSVGEHVVKLNFEGIHNDSMKGFYRSKYNLPDGKEVYNLSTQFESTFARRAFPCIDEPDRKATFEITLVVPDNLVALSNMPEIARKKIEKPARLSDLEEGASYVEVKFDKSPIMSTYLVAMVVGHFEYIEDRDSNGTPVRVYTPIGKKHCGSFAMEVALKCLPFYTERFGVGYPLPKLDLIAIPDFEMGAMENWGLVTFREVTLLVDLEQASLVNKLIVCRVVAHELAHMWFGNLVTMKWWTHLWLNEGFARWCEFHFISNNYKEFDAWSIFASEVQELAFSLDGLMSSHPIEVPVQSPDQIGEIFDTISYAKGASVINMLYNHIGREAFFTGLRHYMNQFQYNNTETIDLWNAFSASSSQDIAQLMSCWTGQQGFPVVKVTKKDKELKFTQFRYTSQGAPEEAGNDSFWRVFCKISDITDSSNILGSVLMPNYESEFVFGPIESDIIVNPGRSSFIRVKYDNDLFAAITRNLGQIDSIDRMSHVSDLFSLAMAGHGSCVDAIHYALCFSEERCYSVWNILYSSLSEIFEIIHDSLCEDSSRDEQVFLTNKNKFFIYLAKRIHQRLGWEARAEDNHSDILLRSSVILALGAAGEESVIREAKKRFLRHYEASMNSTSTTDLIHPDLRESIYKIVCLNYSEEMLDKFIQLIKQATMQDEKVKFYNAIGLTKSLNLAERVIEFCLSEDVRKQDRYIIFNSLSSSTPQVRLFVWNYFKVNIDQITTNLGKDTLLGRILNSLVSKFTSMRMHREIEGLLSKHDFSCRRAIDQALEKIIIRNGILQREGDRLRDAMIAMQLELD